RGEGSAAGGGVRLAEDEHVAAGVEVVAGEAEVGVAGVAVEALLPLLEVVGEAGAALVRREVGREGGGGAVAAQPEGLRRGLPPGHIEVEHEADVRARVEVEREGVAGALAGLGGDGTEG